MTDGKPVGVSSQPIGCEQNRAACRRCSSAIEVDDQSVTCRASRRALSFLMDSCPKRKWPWKRPPLPGVWVLSYPRTGSSYLCATLNQLGFNPSLRELYNPQFGSTPRTPPKNVKVHGEQLTSSGTSLGRVLAERPDTRLIVTRRRDLVACAVSLYLAQYTDVWWVRSDADAKALAGRGSIPYDELFMRSCYRQVVEADTFWRRELEQLGADAHEVVYEDLAADPVGSIENVFGFLGIEGDAELCVAGVPDRRLSVIRPESRVFAERLRGALEHAEVEKSFDFKENGPTMRRAPHRLIVGALSCCSPQYQRRREKCMRTWLPELERAGVEVLFLVGVGDSIDKPRVVEPEEHGRIGRELQIPCPDTYAALPQKTAAFCRWACEQRAFDYLFKCDDDTYLVPGRLLERDLRGIDYLGSPLFIGIPYASGGAGYFLSRRATEYVADQMKEREGPEDLIVSQHLHKNGIRLHPDRGFVAVRNDVLRPKPDNYLVTSHACEWPWSEHHRTWQGAWDRWQVKGDGSPDARQVAPRQRSAAEPIWGIDFPEQDFGIVIIPKNGGTSILRMAYKLRLGLDARGDLYEHYGLVTGRIDQRSRRIVVVRDPIERFVSGFCFLKRKKSLRDEPGLSIDAFIDRFPHGYPAADIQHHLQPQFIAANRTTIDRFTDVIPFSRFGEVFDLVEALSGRSVLRPHMQLAEEDKPLLKPEHLPFLHEYYAIDYEQGYCEPKAC